VSFGVELTFTDEPDRIRDVRSSTEPGSGSVFPFPQSCLGSPAVPALPQSVSGRRRRMLRLPERVPELLRSDGPEAMPEVLHLQVLREGVRESGSAEDAHPHTHSAVCV